MTPTTATTTAADTLMSAAPLAADRPAYRYDGNGRFLPANAAAHEECRRFNAWADDVNARASKRLPQ